MKAHIVTKMYPTGTRYIQGVYSSRKKALGEIQKWIEGYTTLDGYSVKDFKDDYFGWTGVEFLHPEGKTRNNFHLIVESKDIE